MKRIGIATVYTGYNYGSSLQAFATKRIISDLGYPCELLRLQGSLIKGRDVRFGKLSHLALRLLAHPTKIKKNLSTYHNSMTKSISKESANMFDSFTSQYLQPVQYSLHTLKSMASTSKYEAFVCGSDQIWNSTTYYVDPFYYLRFAPKNKRVAFAPSFGRDFIPKYNMKKMKKYISDIPFRSVREATGSKLIETMTGEKPTVLLDPTLVLNAMQWNKILHLSDSKLKKQSPYILAYFLDFPNEKARAFLKELSIKTGYHIVGIPYDFGFDDWYDNNQGIGPREFLSLIQNAALVCTDSFHGTAFSLNFQVPFYTFDRDYGTAEKQSARIISILQLTDTMGRLNPAHADDDLHMGFTYSESMLETEREKARNYLGNAFKRIEKGL